MGKVVCFSAGIISVAVVAGICLQSSSVSEIELIEVIPRAIELGEVASHQRIPTGFEVRNNSEVEYNIVALTGSCSCFVDIIDWPIAVPPGETMFVPIQYQTSGTTGSGKDRLLVSFERAHSRGRVAFQRCIEISYNPVPRIGISPSRLDFGSLASDDDPPSLSFRIASVSNTMYRIESIVATRPEIDITHPKEIGPEGADFQVTFHPARTTARGAVQGAINITLSRGAVDSVSVPFKALLLSPFVARPDILLFDGRSTIGSTVSLTIEGSEPFSLAELRVPDSVAVQNHSHQYSLHHHLAIGLAQARTGDLGNIEIRLLAESGRVETLVVRIGRVPGLGERK